MISPDTRFEMVARRAFEVWTNNGDGLTQELSDKAMEQVEDAVALAYRSDFSDIDWLEATLERLPK